MDGERRFARPVKRARKGRIETALTSLTTRIAVRGFAAVSYTHLTLPTNREV